MRGRRERVRHADPRALLTPESRALRKSAGVDSRLRNGGERRSSRYTSRQSPRRPMQPKTAVSPLSKPQLRNDLYSEHSSRAELDGQLHGTANDVGRWMSAGATPAWRPCCMFAQETQRTAYGRRRDAPLKASGRSATCRHVFQSGPRRRCTHCLCENGRPALQNV